MPCCVVYHETIDSRQLATNKAFTMGRLTATRADDALGIEPPYWLID
jgi:hypothetical protein